MVNSSKPSGHVARHGAYTRAPPVAGSSKRYATTHGPSPGPSADSERAYLGRLAPTAKALTRSPPTSCSLSTDVSDHSQPL